MSASDLLLPGHADDGHGKKTAKLIDFGLHKVIHLHSEEEINAGIYKYALGSKSSHHGTPKGGLELSSLSETENKKQLLGKNGSLHVRSANFTGIQEQVYEMTGGCGSLM